MARMKLDHRLFMRWAHDVANASTCAKVHVGALIVKNCRVVSHGYNGVPTGMLHCCDHFTGELSRQALGEEEFIRQHKIFSEEHELHAETNAIIFALMNGVTFENATLYNTLSPCFNCAKLIIQTGIKYVLYETLHDEKVCTFLKENGVLIGSISDHIYVPVSKHNNPRSA